MGLRRYSVAVSDLNAALNFYQEMFGVEVLYEDDSPSHRLRKTGVQLANTVVELLTPTGDGPITAHLQRYGDGLRSVVFQVRSLDQAIHHFSRHGITLVPGDSDGTLAIPAEHNRGVIMEVTE